MPKLCQVTFRVVSFVQPNLGPAQFSGAIIESTKQPIPNRQELTEVDLSIFEVALVVPAMNLRDSQDSYLVASQGSLPPHEDLSFCALVLGWLLLPRDISVKTDSIPSQMALQKYPKAFIRNQFIVATRLPIAIHW